MKPKFLAGMLIGVAAGALLGILFAPDKGSETRKKLAKKGKDLSDELKEKFGDMEENIEGLKNEAGNILNKGKDMAGEISRQIKGLAEDAKTKLS